MEILEDPCEDTGSGILCGEEYPNDIIGNLTFSEMVSIFIFEIHEITQQIPVPWASLLPLTDNIIQYLT